MPERGAKPNVHPIQRRILDALAAFSSSLLPDDYLELFNPLWSTRELRGGLRESTQRPPDAASVLIKPGYRWGGHDPGQYLRVGLDIRGVRHWRAYSLTSDPPRGSAHRQRPAARPDQSDRGKPAKPPALGASDRIHGSRR